MSDQAHPTTFTSNIAQNYERYFVPLIPAPLAAELVDVAAPVAGEHVVDIACGTGVVARLAAERVGPSGTVVAVDLHPGMLELARSLPAPPGAAIDWREGSATALPLPDDSCDVVLSQLGLMLVDDRPAAAREMRRVTAPGGRVALNVAGSMPRALEIMGEALARHVDPALAGFVGAVFSLDDPGEVERLLRDAGFADVAVRVDTKTFRLPPPADFLWQYAYSTPIGAGLGQADAEALERVERDVVAEWQDFVEDGDLVVEQPIVLATARP